MREWLPIARWLPRLDRRDLRADAIAGVTTAIMLIPQGMGYAMLAGLPPIVGLYTALAPPLAYAVLGTSRQLSVGPVAIDSLLTAVAVSAVASASSERYAEAAVTLAVMVGTIQLALGLLGLGFIANFLSRPVLGGFTSAAAVIIGANQLGHLLGVELPRTHAVFSIVATALERGGRWHMPTLILGVLAIAFLIALRRLRRTLPRGALAMVAATLAVYALGLESRGVAVVGDIPPGLPTPRVPSVSASLLVRLAPAAATIALVGFVEAISIGKRIAAGAGYEIHPGRELLALGCANLSGACFGGFPVTGSFARSAVNAEAGAASPLSGVFCSLVVAAGLLFLSPVLSYMPNVVLAAIIVTAVLGLFDLEQPRRLWKVKRSDFWLLVASFAATLVAGIQYGILIGVAASVGLFLVRTTRPHWAVLGRIPGSEAYLNVARHPHAQRPPGVLVVRIDSQFYFGNVTFLKRTLRALQREMREPLKAVVLDASGINQLDSSALDALQEIDEEYRAHGVRLLFAHVKGPVRDVLCEGGMLQTLGREQRIFLTTQAAVAVALGEATHEERATSRALDPRAAADRVGCGPGPTRDN